MSRPHPPKEVTMVTKVTQCLFLTVKAVCDVYMYSSNKR